MKTHATTIGITVFAAFLCGATFVLALLRQYGLVEVAASLGIGLEVFFLSSSIGDQLEKQREPNRLRTLAAITVAVAITGYFLITGNPSLGQGWVS